MADAYTFNDEPVFANHFSPDDWRALQELSRAEPESFKMECCKARAVLKTSIHGVQFFAHYSDECATAPETQWHISGKDMVIGALAGLGIQGRLEVPGGDGKNRWQADVYFELPGRRIAIELQRSYLHFRDFLKRQDRYRKQGVECYWLVRQENVWKPLVKSIGNRRYKEEFGSVMPEGGFYPAIPELFFVLLDPDSSEPIQGPKMGVTVHDLMKSIVEQRLHYDGICWQIKEMQLE